MGICLAAAAGRENSAREMAGQKDANEDWSFVHELLHQESAVFDISFFLVARISV